MPVGSLVPAGPTSSHTAAGGLTLPDNCCLSLARFVKLDYDHMQLQLLPQLWQATIASACNPDCANALDLSDVAVLGEIAALPPSSPVKPDRIIGTTCSSPKDCLGGQ